MTLELYSEKVKTEELDQNISGKDLISLSANMAATEVEEICAWVVAFLLDVDKNPFVKIPLLNGTEMKQNLRFGVNNELRFKGMNIQVCAALTVNLKPFSGFPQSFEGNLDKIVSDMNRLHGLFMKKFNDEEKVYKRLACMVPLNAREKHQFSILIFESDVEEISKEVLVGFGMAMFGQVGHFIMYEPFMREITARVSRLAKRSSIVALQEKWASFQTDIHPNFRPLTRSQIVAAIDKQSLEHVEGIVEIEDPDGIPRGPFGPITRPAGYESPVQPSEEDLIKGITI